MEKTKLIDKQMLYDTLVNRLEYTVKYRLKDKTRIEKAMKLQDKIRAMTKGRGINLTEEIRKWRDRR